MEVGERKNRGPSIKKKAHCHLLTLLFLCASWGLIPAGKVHCMKMSSGGSPEVGIGTCDFLLTIAVLTIRFCSASPVVFCQRQSTSALTQTGAQCVLREGSCIIFKRRRNRQRYYRRTGHKLQGTRLIV